jgi:hypothetical protein
LWGSPAVSNCGSGWTYPRRRSGKIPARAGLGLEEDASESFQEPRWGRLVARRRGREGDAAEQRAAALEVFDGG